MVKYVKVRNDRLAMTSFLTLNTQPMKIFDKNWMEKLRKKAFKKC